jgi:hypothetical protein
MDQADLNIKRDLLSKITKAKRGGVLVQEVEHLPQKHKALYVYMYI